MVKYLVFSFDHTGQQITWDTVLLIDGDRVYKDEEVFQLFGKERWDLYEHVKENFDLIHSSDACAVFVVQ